MTDPASIPPGWYSGGVPGEERWWDGAAWTTHARPVVTSTPRFQWGGNPEASLVVGILCIVPALLSIGFLLFSLLTFQFLDALRILAAAFGFTAFALIGILNFFGVRRQRARQAAEAAWRAQPPVGA